MQNVVRAVSELHLDSMVDEQAKSTCSEDQNAKQNVACADNVNIDMNANCQAKMVSKMSASVTQSSVGDDDLKSKIKQALPNLSLTVNSQSLSSVVEDIQRSSQISDVSMYTECATHTLQHWDGICKGPGRAHNVNVVEHATSVSNCVSCNSAVVSQVAKALTHLQSDITQEVNDSLLAFLICAVAAFAVFAVSEVGVGRSVVDNIRPIMKTVGIFVIAVYLMVECTSGISLAGVPIINKFPPLRKPICHWCTEKRTQRIGQGGALVLGIAWIAMLRGEGQPQANKKNKPSTQDGHRLSFERPVGT